MFSSVEQALSLLPPFAKPCLSVNAPVYVALLHYPMRNRMGEQVATAVTNLDIHDISRSCRTYGVKRYFIVTPVIEQHRVVGQILNHWKRDSSREWHPDRFEALARVQLAEDFETVKAEIFSKHGEYPEVVLTDASPLPNAVTYADYRRELEDPKRTKPALIVFGTGWGISDVFYPEVHRILAPVYGLKNDSDGEYNHLSVRAAAAIILDRLFGH